MYVLSFTYITQVKQCEVCQRTKCKFNKPAPSLHPIPVSDTWNKVGIDLVELPLSQNGNRYCITLTDYFSKWAEAAAIPTKEATHVVAFLYKMILRHGCPQEIVSDQRREFCNKLVDSLEELTGFKHKITSAYHSQSNGLDEHFDQTLKAQLQKLVNTHQDDWDNLLDSILLAYRSSRHNSTKCSPFLLMYGREARLPIDLTRTQCEGDCVELNLETKVQQMLELQQQLHDKARSNIEEAQACQKCQYNAKHDTIDEEDDDVPPLPPPMPPLSSSCRTPPLTTVPPLPPPPSMLLSAPIADDCVVVKSSIPHAPLLRLKRRRVVQLSKRSQKKAQRVTEITLDPKQIELVNEGRMLTDNHIDYANKLLRKQFPDVRGLQTPLLGQSLTYAVTEPPFVQILHVNSLHWMTVVGVHKSLVKVYDSLYKYTSTCVTSQAAAILKSQSDHILFQIEKTQFQQGGLDCGLFAIAFATEFCYGNNPECYRYVCLLYTSPSPRDATLSRMPSSA